MAEVGAAVTGYAPGDRIAFISMMQPKEGVWAQYAAVRTDSGGDELREGPVHTGTSTGLADGRLGIAAQP